MQGQISQIHDNTSSLDTFSIYNTIHVHGVMLAVRYQCMCCWFAAQCMCWLTSQSDWWQVWPKH